MLHLGDFYLALAIGDSTWEVRNSTICSYGSRSWLWMRDQPAQRYGICRQPSSQICEKREWYLLATYRPRLAFDSLQCHPSSPLRSVSSVNTGDVDKFGEFGEKGPAIPPDSPD